MVSSYLQDKYNMKSPEEFFEISTFLDNPIFFYEFCKIFDLSKTKQTLTHKFISFLTKKLLQKLKIFFFYFNKIKMSMAGLYRGCAWGYEIRKLQFVGWTKVHQNKGRLNSTLLARFNHEISCARVLQYENGIGDESSIMYLLFNFN